MEWGIKCESPFQIAILTLSNYWTALEKILSIGRLYTLDFSWEKRRATHKKTFLCLFVELREPSISLNRSMFFFIVAFCVIADDPRLSDLMRKNNKWKNVVLIKRTQ